MSLENSMNTLAEANLVLAAAMTKYATVMQNHLAANGGSAVTSDEEPSTPATTAKGKRRTKEEIAADAKKEADAMRDAGGGAEEIDPFADEAEEPTEKPITKDDVRKLVLAVKEKNEDFAKKLLEKLGVKTLGTIAEKDYPKVVELAGKVGVTL